MKLAVVIFSFLSTEPGHGGDRVGAVHRDPAEGESICPTAQHTSSHLTTNTLLYAGLHRASQGFTGTHFYYFYY